MSELLSFDCVFDTAAVLGSVGELLLTLCPVILLYGGFRIIFSFLHGGSCATLSSIVFTWLWKKVLQPCLCYLNKTVFTPCFRYLKRKFIEYLES